MTEPSEPAETEDQRQQQAIEAPPTSFKDIALKIGPGLIIAANIVGSGELIMSTKAGAEAGIALLWLILIGCVIKVFVQLELGRFTISHGETTLKALNRIPGPGIGRTNWVLVLWGIMMLSTVGQLGGIVGGVGQALALTIPITGDVQTATRIPATQDIQDYSNWLQSLSEADREAGATGLSQTASPDTVQQLRRMVWIERDLKSLGDTGQLLLQRVTDNEELVDNEGQSLIPSTTVDDRIWVSIIGVLTAMLLFVGRYQMIERVSVILVVSFSLITIGNVVALQSTADYSVSADDIWQGLSFGLPDTDAALFAALATLGIIGVGATELVSYPYWCLEKGYAKSTGPRQSNDAWKDRAAGWFKVMKVDAFASMIIYTIATAAFYLMGVAVLHSDGRVPEGMRMVSTLAESYVPIFGSYARWLFLAGAIAVLYSTYLVANAGNARMVADFLNVAGLSSAEPDSDARRKMVTIFSVVLPLSCVIAYFLFPKPVILVAISGITQFLMLPVLGFCALFFRFKVTDTRLRPTAAWDVLLVLSCLAMLTAGGYGAYAALARFLSM
ncbi:MAG: Nramp family divalent metal transporter [Fuerstiella sp.]